MTVALSLAACALGLFLTYKTNQKETRFLKLEKEVMEYRALQMQINPHFLNNTLETINWSAVALFNGPNDVSRMIQLLSRMLKYAMEIPENPGVLLEEEIEHTKYYLELQDIRFARRFSVDWYIGSLPGTLRVPKLIFQPILENSFTHGFKDEIQPLKISIDIHQLGQAEDRVVIEIADDGEGIDGKILAQLNVDEPAIPDGASLIGLVNIRKRVLLFYKGNAEFVLWSEKKKGTKIRISVPV
jgi:two-component system sensor histidine kinase YesM